MGHPLLWVHYGKSKSKAGAPGDLSTTMVFRGEFQPVFRLELAAQISSISGSVTTNAIVYPVHNSMQRANPSQAVLNVMNFSFYNFPLDRMQTRD